MTADSLSSVAYQSLARDGKANEWLDANVEPRVTENIRRWARLVIDKNDEVGQAEIGALLTTIHVAELVGGGTIRGHAYSLIFTYPEYEERKQVCETCFLRVSDSNQVVELIKAVDRPK